MGNEAVCGSIFRVPGNELFLVFALEEVKYAWAVAHNFQVGIVHGQLSESEDSAAMVNVRTCVKRRFEICRMAAGIEN